jgi:hypothetical protein
MDLLFGEEQAISINLLKSPTNILYTRIDPVAFELHILIYGLKPKEVMKELEMGGNSNTMWW